MTKHRTRQMLDAPTIVVGMFLCGLLLLGLEGFLVQNTWTGSRFGYSLHAASLFLFAAVTLLGASRRYDFVPHTYLATAKTLDHCLTYTLLLLLAGRALQHFGIADLVFLDQLIGDTNDNSYTSLGTLLGLAIVQCLDAGHDRLKNGTIKRWFYYLISSFTFFLYFHHGVHLLTQTEVRNMSGVSILSAFIIALLVMLTFIRSAAIQLLIDVRFPKSNLISITLIMLAISVAGFFGPALSIENTGLFLGTLLVTLVPLVTTKSQKSELQELIKTGVLAPNGEAYDREIVEPSGEKRKPEGSLFIKWIFWETFEASSAKRCLSQGIVTFLLALGAIALSRIDNTAAQLWWANAYLSYMLVIREYKSWPRAITIFLTAVLAANIISGNSLKSSLQITAINAVEGIAIAAITIAVLNLKVIDRKIMSQRATVSRVSMLIACSLLGCLMTAFLGGGMTASLFGGSVNENIYNWFVSSAIGYSAIGMIALGIIMELHFNQKPNKGSLAYAPMTLTLYVFFAWLFSKHVPLQPFVLFSAGIAFFVIPLAFLPSLIQTGISSFFITLVFWKSAQSRDIGLFETLTIPPEISFTLLATATTVALIQVSRYFSRQEIEQQKVIFDDSPFAVLATTIDGRVLYASGQVRKIFGIPDLSFQRRKLEEILNLRAVEKDEKNHEHLLTSFKEGEQILRYVDSTGGERTIRATTKKISDPSFSFSLVTTLEDITDLVEQQHFSASLVDKSTAIILTEDADFKIMSCSRAWSATTGFTRDETIGREFIDFMTPEHQNKARRVREMIFETTYEERSYNTDIVSKTGEIIKLMLNVRVDTSGVNERVILTANDITAAKAAEEQLKLLVERDELTGLYSRRGLNRNFSDDQRTADMGLYLIDLDHFKSVNDGYGHDAGDMLLKATAHAIEDQTKKDGNCFRLGGEEFAILRPWRGWEEAREFAQSLCRRIGATSIQSDGHSIQRTASIGVAYLQQSGSISETLKLSDMVLREAKASGRNRAEFADELMLQKLRTRGMFIQPRAVQQALESGELKYFVQPIYESKSTTIIGFEALIRWQLPSGELIEPKKFVNLLSQVVRHPKYAELKLGIRAQLLQQLKDYPQQYVSFNFKLEQIGYLGSAQKLHTDIQSILDHPERRIVIELSESALHSRVNEDVLIDELSKLQAYGYMIALDDFGIEASNIQRLLNYPIDIVKIDRSLITDIETSEKARKMVESTAVLLQSLDIAVTVEGVERKQQADLLTALGLNIHQGFLYSEPIPPQLVTATNSVEKSSRRKLGQILPLP